mgnify:CR=1 FL=1
MLNKRDLKIEYMIGSGPGGQSRQKNETACRITHIESGIQSYANERTRSVSYRKALEGLEDKIKAVAYALKAKKKHANRLDKIRNTKTIRTYNFKNQTVKDHRTKKIASLKEVLRGNLGLLRDTRSTSI